MYAQINGSVKSRALASNNTLSLAKTVRPTRQGKVFAFTQPPPTNELQSAKNRQIATCFGEAKANLKNLNLPKKANAMAPLKMENKGHFEYTLDRGKSIGIDGISVDLWWGLAEKASGEFDFSYYKDVFQSIKDRGLKIIPIISFHACGTNVGDANTIPIPDWVWDVEGVEKYKSSQYKECPEVVSLWSDDKIMPYYERFINAFCDQMGEFSECIDEIIISTGPAGELRYPSYNSHDDRTDYPFAGALQCYSDKAQADFQKHLLNQYQSLEGINATWQTHYQNIEEIVPANLPYMHDPVTFYGSQPFKDLYDWYNAALLNHGKTMMQTANTAIQGQFRDAPIGLKLAGIHWRMADGSVPRIAELNGGVIRFDDHSNLSADDHGYGPFLRMVRDLNSERPAGVILHFTCLEMKDDPSEPAASQAGSLVQWIGQGSQKYQIPVGGENALNGSLWSHQCWDQIERAFNDGGYNRMTILRLHDIFAEDSPAANRYQQFISRNIS